MIFLVNSNPVHEPGLQELQRQLGARYVSTREELSSIDTPPAEALLFFFHWSWIIPPGIYEKYECILFHMTDLPYGRGGSPLQNLIVRGGQSTKLTALRVAKGLDTGDVYLKKDLSLTGTAREIFLRAQEVMVEMTHYIINHRPVPVPQIGEPTIFQRRKPEEGDLSNLKELAEVYDYIRMLDADGYPPAFVDVGPFRITFDQAKLHQGNLTASARISIR